MQSNIPEIVYKLAMKSLTIDVAKGTIHWGKRPMNQFASRGYCEAWHKRWLGKPVGYIVGTHRNLGFKFYGFTLTNARVLAYAKWGSVVLTKYVGHYDGDYLNMKGSNLYLMDAKTRYGKGDKNKVGKSGMRGLSFRRGMWCVYKRINGRLTYLGSYETSAKAQHAFDLEKKL